MELVLFDRSQRRLLLTQTGQKFHVRAREVLASVSDLSAYAAAIRSNDTRTVLRVAALSRHARSLVAPAVAHILSRNRAAHHIKIDVQTQRDFAWTSRTRPFDIGFGNLEGKHDNLVFEAIAKSALVAIVPRAHRLSQASSIVAADLTDERLVLSAQDTTIASHFEQLLPRQAAHHAVVEASTSHVAFELVRLGVGIHLTDRLAAWGPDQDQHRIVPFKPEKFITIGAFYPAALKALHPAAQDLLDKVRMIAATANALADSDVAARAPPRKPNPTKPTSTNRPQTTTKTTTSKQRSASPTRR